jgi:hypothetical protein
MSESRWVTDTDAEWDKIHINELGVNSKISISLILRCYTMFHEKWGKVRVECRVIAWKAEMTL